MKFIPFFESRYQQVVLLNLFRIFEMSLSDSVSVLEHNYTSSTFHGSQSRKFQVFLSACGCFISGSNQSFQS